MGNMFNLDMQIDENYIKQSVENIVKAGIASALGDPSKIIQAAIGKVLDAKVDCNGKPTTFSSGKRYLDYLVETAVAESAKEVIKEEIDSHREKIKETLVKRLRNGKWLDAYAESLLTQTSETISNQWRTHVEVKFEKPQDSY